MPRCTQAGLSGKAAMWCRICPTRSAVLGHGKSPLKEIRVFPSSDAKGIVPWGKTGRSLMRGFRAATAGTITDVSGRDTSFQRRNADRSRHWNDVNPEL